MENLSNYVVIKSLGTITSYVQLKKINSGRYICNFNLPNFKTEFTLLKVYRVNKNLDLESDIFISATDRNKEYIAFINSNGYINEFPVV